MVGDEIKALIAKEGVLRKDIAKSMGVTPGAVTQYLDAPRVSYATVERILSILGYDIKWVKRGVDEEKVALLPNPLMDVPGAEKLTLDDLSLIRALAAGLVAQK